MESNLNNLETKVLGAIKLIKELREEGLVRPEMFVEKPVDPESLVAMVHKIIGS